jgi:hypothetical protein
VGAELEPQFHDCGVVVERATLYEHVRHGRGRTLPDRVAVEGGIRSGQTPGFMVGDASDGIYYLFAVPVYGNLQTPLGPRFDQLVDSFLDPLLKVFHRLIPS